MRFREEPAFRALFIDAGLIVDDIIRGGTLAPALGARWIAAHIAFAPGMTAMIDGVGPGRTRVLETFVAAIEHDQGRGEVVMSAVAHIGIAAKPQG